MKKEKSNVRRKGDVLTEYLVKRKANKRGGENGRQSRMGTWGKNGEKGLYWG